MRPTHGKKQSGAREKRGKSPRKGPREPEEFQNRAGEEPPPVTTREEAISEGVKAAERDPHFDAELRYEGYAEIEEYDNTVLGSSLDRKKIAVHDLRPRDREAGEGDEIEESPLDPQGNR